jgi:hypothetical protein
MKTKFKSYYPASFKVSLKLLTFTLQNACLRGFTLYIKSNFSVSVKFIETQSS